MSLAPPAPLNLALLALTTPEPAPVAKAARDCRGCECCYRDECDDPETRCNDYGCPCTTGPRISLTLSRLRRRIRRGF